MMWSLLCCCYCCIINANELVMRRGVDDEGEDLCGVMKPNPKKWATNDVIIRGTLFCSSDEVA